MDAEIKFHGFIALAVNEESRNWRDSAEGQTQPQHPFPSPGLLFLQKKKNLSAKVSRNFPH